MKLESTLPEGPGLLFAVPVLDLFALLLAMLLLVPSFIARSGVSVDLPPSHFQYDRFVRPLVVSIGAGENPVVFVGYERVALEHLGRKLDEEREKPGGTAGRIVVLRVDRSAPVGIERKVAELALRKGFRVMLAGRIMDEKDGGKTQPDAKLRGVSPGKR
jgi:biopolymer transport protein ExbD